MLCDYSCVQLWLYSPFVRHQNQLCKRVSSFITDENIRAALELRWCRRPQRTGDRRPLREARKLFKDAPPAAVLHECGRVCCLQRRPSCASAREEGVPEAARHDVAPCSGLCGQHGPLRGSGRCCCKWADGFGSTPGCRGAVHKCTVRR